MTYQLALMGFNGDYVIKGVEFENTDDALAGELSVLIVQHI